MTNLLLFVLPPRLPQNFRFPFSLPILPDPHSVPIPDSWRELAAQIRQNRIPALGFTLDIGPEIHWRRDHLNHIETGLSYFRLIPYLDAQRAGDHKVIWEINRHQHLVLLAQCGYVEDVVAQLESWIKANPFHRGINWTSALEVAFRALSWIWIYHLIGNQWEPGFHRRFLEVLYQHGRHLEINLSFYFSPNTHLLGEAVALHALGALFPTFPRAGRWKKLGNRVVIEQMDRQVRADGSHFEQSTYYHVYALDMFLFHAILSEPTREYKAKLTKMADYLHALLGPARKLPLLGDDDGGRFFHPYGTHDEFGRATLATAALYLNHDGWPYQPEDLLPQAAWWLGTTQGSSCGRWQSQLFPDAGVAVMTASDTQVVIDAGPFGPWGSGHSHSDTLSITARKGDHEILIDPATYTYVGDPEWRDWFRGSAAHSTIRINRLDQATPVNPFRWQDQPTARVLDWKTSDMEDLLVGECSYRGFTHRRQVRFEKPSRIVIEDDITGPAGEHLIEQFWHLGNADTASMLDLESGAEHIDTWRSPALGVKQPNQALRVARQTALPARLSAVINLDH